MTKVLIDLWLFSSLNITRGAEEVPDNLELESTVRCQDPDGNLGIRIEEWHFGDKNVGIRMKTGILGIKGIIMTSISKSRL